MKNILVILVDCLRADVCYGRKGKAHTPTIEVLKKRGVAFTKMMAVTTTTTPSAATMLTGMYPARHGVRTLAGYGLSSKAKTIPELLKEVGYHTAAFVSGPITPESGLNRGFDEYELKYGQTLIYGDWGDGFIARLKKMPEPWFTLLHIWELHTPRCVRGGFDKPKFGRTSYERALSSVDYTLGRWFERLDLNNTAVFLTGDHGENFDPPLVERLKAKAARSLGVRLKSDRRYPDGLYHGYNVFDFLINVPFIAAGPGIPEGREVGLLSSQVDILPTLLDTAGAGGLVPAGIQGRSLVPAIMGESMPPREVYLEACGIVIPSSDDWLKGVRTESWKYIYAPKNPSVEPLLFDLERDPEEAVNLAKKMPDKAGAMREMILRFDREAEMALVGEAMSESEADAMKERLKALGYM